MGAISRLRAALPGTDTHAAIANLEEAILDLHRNFSEKPGPILYPIQRVRDWPRAGLSPEEQIEEIRKGTKIGKGLVKVFKERIKRG